MPADKKRRNRSGNVATPLAGESVMAPTAPIAHGLVISADEVAVELAREAVDVRVFPDQVTVLANRQAFFEVHVTGTAAPLRISGPEWLQVTGAPLSIDGAATLTLSAVYGHDGPLEGELTVGNAVVRVALQA